MDPTEGIVLAPLAWSVFVFFGCAIVVRSARVSFEKTIVYWLPWIAVAALLTPFMEGARRLFGFAWESEIVSFAPALILVAFAMAAGAWVIRETKNPLRGIIAAFSLLALWGFMLAVPSIIAWFGRSADIPVFSWSSAELSRAAVLLSMDGYWWTDARARFLGIRNEVETSAILLRAALAFLACAWTGIVFSWRTWWSVGTASAREPSVHRAAFFLAWGFALAWMRGAAMDVRFVNIAAFLVMATTAALFFIALATRREKESSFAIFSALAFAGAWLLGWPVFLLAVAAAMLPLMVRMVETRTRWKPWADSVQEGCAAVVSAAAAWITAARLQDFSFIPIALVLAIFAATFGHRIAEEKNQWLWAAGGFLAAGILFDSRVAIIFSSLIAAATFFAWQRQPRRARESSLWFYVFFAVALAFAG